MYTVCNTFTLHMTVAKLLHVFVMKFRNNHCCRHSLILVL